MNILLVSTESCLIGGVFLMIDEFSRNQGRKFVGWNSF